MIGKHCAALAVILLGWASAASAYTAAGDRIMPATVLLPQLAPSDEFYMTGVTLPQQPTAGGPTGRLSTLSATYSKTITDRFSVTLTEAYQWTDPGQGRTLTGWQNTQASVQYLAVLDPEREALLSVGMEREFGGTGTRRIGADRTGATQPTLYATKGLGDFDIGYLRPLALGAVVGYQFADNGRRANQWTTGLLIEYSIPYLISKVDTSDLPAVLRGLTPMIEVSFTNPVGPGAGKATALIAPGFNYSGEGWDIGVEALIPTSRATGSGVGVAAQLHLSLDFLFPTTIGRPLF